MYRPARGGRSCEHFGGYKTINRIPLPLVIIIIIIIIIIIKIIIIVIIIIETAFVLMCTWKLRF